MDKATGVLQYLEGDDNIEWDERGNVYIQGRKIDNSNITDLIHGIVRKRKSVPKPHGYDDLVEFLQERNAPKEILGHDPVFSTPPQSPLPSAKRSTSSTKGFIKEDDGWIGVTTK